MLHWVRELCTGYWSIYLMISLCISWLVYLSHHWSTVSHHWSVSSSFYLIVGLYLLSLVYLIKLRYVLEIQTLTKSYAHLTFLKPIFAKSHLPIPLAAFRKYPKALWCSPNTKCDWPTKKYQDDWQVSHQLHIRLAYSWRWRYWWVERRNSGKRALCRDGQLWYKCQGLKGRASIIFSFSCQIHIREKNLATRLFSSWQPFFNLCC